MITLNASIEKWNFNSFNQFYSYWYYTCELQLYKLKDINKHANNLMYI